MSRVFSVIAIGAGTLLSSITIALTVYWSMTDMRFLLLPAAIVLLLAAFLIRRDCTTYRPADPGRLPARSPPAF